MKEDNDYVCVLIHGEECVNNKDCENCDYGVNCNFFKEDKIS